MLSEIIIIMWLAIMSAGDQDTYAFRRATAPYTLDIDKAREHLVAARVAGARYRLDPDLLLATAHGESNYQQRVSYTEVSGRDSCGVLQVTSDPKVCTKLNASLIAGYSAGARVLRAWLDSCRGGVWCALSGYAGGYQFIERCRHEPARWPSQCVIPADRIMRASRLKALRNESYPIAVDIEVPLVIEGHRLVR